MDYINRQILQIMWYGPATWQARLVLIVFQYKYVVDLCIVDNPVHIVCYRQENLINKNIITES